MLLPPVAIHPFLAPPWRDTSSRASAEERFHLETVRMKRTFLTLLVCSIHFFRPSLLAQSSDSLVQMAWSAWNQNDRPAVERLFQSALRADPTNARAYLGLSYLYAYQDEQPAAWEQYRTALKHVSNPAAHVFAAWITSKFLDESEHYATKIVPMLRSIADDPQMVPTLQAAACDRLGEFYEARNDLDRSTEYFDRQNTIDHWMLIGPFDNTSASGFDRVFAPETTYDARAAYPGKNSIPTAWFEAKKIRRDRWVDLTHFFSHTNAVYYGNTFVFVPTGQRVHVRVGTSGSVKVFLNDDPVIEVEDENNNDMDTYIVESELQPGWNRLLVKCGYSEISACNFKVRITDLDGKRIRELRTSLDQQPYPARPGTRARTVENFAERYFRSQWEAHPTHLENALLLAETYLRNDKAVEAELVLRSALRQAPNCAMIHSLLMEAFIRGEKYEELTRTREALQSLDPRGPLQLLLRLNASLENENFDQAEECLRQMEEIQPGSLDVLNQRIAVSARRKQSELFLRTLEEAIRRFPEHWDFTYLKALIVLRGQRDPGMAASIVKEYLERRLTTNALELLLQIRLEAANIDGWSETIAQLQELRPGAPGYPYHRATVLKDIQRHDDALEAIDEALAICPGNSVYWHTRGLILRALDKREDARQAFQRSLSFDPANFDARDALRDLDGKGSAFAHFDSVDVPALIRAAKPADQYPHDDALILLNELKRVVYDQGSTEYIRERVIRVHNTRGIDQFKEEEIDYNSYMSRLVIERAVTIKPSGAEFKADINRNQIVFKSLEPGDVLHLKYRVRNVVGGLLSEHFSDAHRFTQRYPVHLSRYAVIAPADLELKFRTQMIENAPVVRNTPDGVLRTWTVQDAPGIVPEPEMPSLDRVGRVLFVSTIRSWDEIIRWYDGLTRTKARKTFEIAAMVREVLPDSVRLTDREKAILLHAFIGDKVRYSSVSFRQSGIVPQKARDVLATRIGDCKDIAVLYVAMLKEVGIPAWIVLMSTRGEENSPLVLPSLVFNHAVVAVQVGRDTVLVDLTARNVPFGSLPDDDVGSFILHIRNGATDLDTVRRGGLPARTIQQKTSITVREDESVLISCTDLRSGSAAASIRARFRDESAKGQEREMQKRLEGIYPGMKLVTFGLEGLDPRSPHATQSYTVEVRNFLTSSQAFVVMKSPWTSRWEQWSALSNDTRQYPLDFWPSLESVSEEITITLPSGYTLAEPIPPVTLRSTAAEYTTSIRSERGTLIATRRLVYKKDTIPPSEYAEFKKFYNAVVANDSAPILIKKRK